MDMPCCWGGYPRGGGHPRRWVYTRGGGGYSWSQVPSSEGKVGLSGGREVVTKRGGGYAGDRYPRGVVGMPGSIQEGG